MENRLARVPLPSSPLTSQDSLPTSSKKDTASRYLTPVSAHPHEERDACGVGFVAAKGHASHEILLKGLVGLSAVEHRGARGADGISTDGAGILCSIPHELLGLPSGSGVAMLFLPKDPDLRKRELGTLSSIVKAHGLSVLSVREVPVNSAVLGAQALESEPYVAQLFLSRPSSLSREHYRETLYRKIGRDIEQLRQRGDLSLSVCSLSADTIVYKALCSGDQLSSYYADLANPKFVTTFVVFHRRFSTNTRTSWDKAQPFSFLAHNGEINTIEANRAAMHARERALGLNRGALLNRKGLSDSGSLDQTIGALLVANEFAPVRKAHLSGGLPSILEMLIPPARQGSPLVNRMFESWDGPALVTASDGTTLAARLDRSGLRPFHYLATDAYIAGCSEAGAFGVPPEQILQKGRLGAGESITVDLLTGTWEAIRPAPLPQIADAPVTLAVKDSETPNPSTYSEEAWTEHSKTYCVTKEELTHFIKPLGLEGKEDIGSMGDTAGLAALSSLPRAFGDYLFESFAQVTNPPVDYLRERSVIDTRVYLGGAPLDGKKNPPLLLEFPHPVLNLEQIDALRKLSGQVLSFKMAEIDATLPLDASGEDLKERLKELSVAAETEVIKGAGILLITDREATKGRIPLPPVLITSVIQSALARRGILPSTSLVIESGDIKNSHELAMVIAAGAHGVIPTTVLHGARCMAVREKREPLPAEQKAIKGLVDGLLKTMSKMGITVVRSYQGGRLFTPLGLGDEITALLGDMRSPLGGIGFSELMQQLKARRTQGSLPHLALYRESPQGGERHEMKGSVARYLHGIIKELRINKEDFSKAAELYRTYLDTLEASEPTALRHHWNITPLGSAAPLHETIPLSEVTAYFGSGAISFGAIAKEPHRDLIRAMALVGGRSNGGEGGENPFYYSHGFTNSTKQVASGHFGVSAEYLNRDTSEIQIKIGQGAKPGEGGQLPGPKVSAEIAQARNAKPGTMLISPPPLHDIYSIEDLAQKIDELRRVNPFAKISVKLVSGAHLGAIAVGVAKCGADIIHIAGHDGGTGAAGLLSMKHAGLPWEIGLADAHHALTQEGLRSRVTLRVDGGLSSGRDIIIASMLGADQFDFGKLLLIGEGCLFLRICHLNTCTPGIATQDPKYQKNYSARQEDKAEDVANLLRIIGEDVRHQLARLGARSLEEIRGRAELLSIKESSLHLEKRGLTFSPFFKCATYTPCTPRVETFEEIPGGLEKEVSTLFEGAVIERAPVAVTPRDRALGASYAGMIARETHRRHLARISRGGPLSYEDLDASRATGTLHLRYHGSAGQAFGVFCGKGLSLTLEGEANDSVAKSMSGGMVVIKPHQGLSLEQGIIPLIGNVALYGATGGTLYVGGSAGDRFAVRNSGAVAIVESTGMHACEYMTAGKVVILGPTGPNVGAGMTGGALFLNRSEVKNLNTSYVETKELSPQDKLWLVDELTKYQQATGSSLAGACLEKLYGVPDLVRVDPLIS